MNSNKLITDIVELSNFLLSLNNVIIFTHERPDGDAIGAGIALSTAFKNIGKKADLYFHRPFPLRYERYSIENFSLGRVPKSFNYTYSICLDSGSLERTAIWHEFKKEILEKPIINIDHHRDNDLFGTINYVDPNACATCEILFDVLKSKSQWSISKPVADSLLLGMIMDTGGFRFDNTNGEVLKKASELIALGADYLGLMKDMFFKKPFQVMNLESDLILNYLKKDCEGKFAYCYISEELLSKHGVDKKDTEGIIDAIRIIDGVEVVALIMKKDQGFRVSLRSNNLDFPIVDIAHKFNGGGHSVAAGCFIDSAHIEEAEYILIKEIKKLFTKE